ncbi:hypothetical protein GCM10009678_02140 [Actinomadura kijaniata]|uniref:Aryl-alcohol dehydrogenase-like predicted oxidoreductase n=1 Tax=Actinomadura namibiensis TaxID=182080 RepID=A0A7W3LTU9_ACTNM|nr:hypothetical protein [Actinomadura namibiensis]MBA8954213.1 aryl-alcohol dehydrogenase-like predicted oxidoreductase [Actinomadura namibiensis]
MGVRPTQRRRTVTLVSEELAELIVPGLSASAAALASAASTPEITGALSSASTAAHLHDALTVFQHAPLPPEHLWKICRVLRA